MARPSRSATPPGLIDGRALAAQMFRYSPPHRVLICIPCRCAVFDTESQLSRHLRKFHRHGPGPHLSTADAIEYFGEFPDRVRRIGCFQPPSWPMPAIPGLPVHRNTFQCTYPSCQYIGRDVHRIQEHARRRHAWENPDLRLRHNRSLDRESLPWTRVTSQSLIARGRGATYYPVVVDPSYRTVPAGVAGTEVSNEQPATPEVVVAIPPPRTKRQAPSSSTRSTRAISYQSPLPGTPAAPLAPASSPNVPASSRPTEAIPRRRSSPRVTSSQLHPQPTANRLRAAVKEWGNYCVLCRRILGDLGAPDTPHSQIEVVRFHDCDHRSASAVQAAQQQLLQWLLNRRQSHSCAQCALPLKYCGKNQPVSIPDSQRGGHEGPEAHRGLRANCRFPSAVVPMVLGVLVEEFDGAKEQLLRWITEGGVDADDDAAVYDWLATSIVWADMECFRVTQVFVWLHELIVRDPGLCRAYRIGDHGFKG